MAKIPSTAELAKTHISLTEQLEAAKLLDNKTLKRLIEVLKVTAPRGIVDPTSAHATIAAYSKQEGYLQALDQLGNLQNLKTIEDRLLELKPSSVSPLFDSKD